MLGGTRFTFLHLIFPFSPPLIHNGCRGFSSYNLALEWGPSTATCYTIIAENLERFLYYVAHFLPCYLTH